MILSPRLLEIASCVTEKGTLLDMGTDHGYLPVFLIQSTVIEHAIASDVSLFSLKKAESLIVKCNLESKIETRLGNGLEVINPGECQTIIMAGMGGHLIHDIILDNLEKINQTKQLILQPMNNVSLVRKTLEKSGRLIVKEKLVKEGKRFYQIIVSIPGEMAITRKDDYVLGYRPARENTSCFFDFVLLAIEKQRAIIQQLLDKNTPKAKKQLKQSKEMIMLFEEVLNHG